jgi:hypothetical protein
MNINSLLLHLSDKRPIFHSEADFQHALAWDIQRHHPEASIRLEYRPAISGTRMYVDVWVGLPDGRTLALELKYKSARLDLEREGEVYTLLNQSAQDIGRYDFLKDISRLERLVSARPDTSGVAIMLTNDSGYWNASRSTQTVDAAFRLHERRSLSGELFWGAGASAGTMRSREQAITLQTQCDVKWTDYSQIGSGRNNRFRSLVVTINPFGEQPVIQTT